MTPAFLICLSLFLCAPEAEPLLHVTMRAR